MSPVSKDLVKKLVSVATIALAAIGIHGWLSPEIEANLIDLLTDSAHPVITVTGLIGVVAGVLGVGYGQGRDPASGSWAGVFSPLFQLLTAKPADDDDEDDES